ncbi:hypothetical protein AAC387_Pa02g1531 [Persea americana]
MSTQKIVEHVVFFKVKPDTSSSKIDSMISNLRSLVSLPPVLHLTAGPSISIDPHRSISLTSSTAAIGPKKTSPPTPPIRPTSTPSRPQSSPSMTTSWPWTRLPISMAQ